MANDSKAYSFGEKMDFFFFFFKEQEPFSLLSVISEDEILYFLSLVKMKSSRYIIQPQYHPSQKKSQRTRTFSLLSVISEDEILMVHYPNPLPPFLDSPSPSLPS